MATSLICSETQSRVSSVLHRDVKQYGKKYMFDNNEETCWNSDQGECQWVSLDFPKSVRVSEIKILFQGGFSAKTCILEDYFPSCAFCRLPQRRRLHRDQPVLPRRQQLSSELSHTGGPRSG
ncbi:nuclear receptor 2C2-associated protein isoform X2 [Kryptolebias marmoratus]|uniref:nuclear receptor 2C2-associated protein isoform X2 n=1 Tax=Kryptolebias marmoratus TaxID=37003 RepID=UPI0018ACCE2A|nr:nuclear receptor 2C2-associated protein isoform X2 [Kryptolebias marmoratus]